MGFPSSRSYTNLPSRTLALEDLKLSPPLPRASLKKTFRPSGLTTGKKIDSGWPFSGNVSRTQSGWSAATSSALATVRIAPVRRSTISRSRCAPGFQWQP